MNDVKNSEKPEVYALRQNADGWQISRRDFLKAAGTGAAAIGAGLGSGFLNVSSAEDDIVSVCKSAAAHQNNLQRVMTAADGKWLISLSNDGSGSIIKAWNFDTLVMNSRKKFKKGITLQSAGFIGGDPALTYTSNEGLDRINYMCMEEPLLYKGKTHEIRLNKEKVTAITVGKNGNIYAGDEGKTLYIAEKKGDSDKFNKPKTFTLPETIVQCSLIDDGNTLFARFDSGKCGLVDLNDGSVKEFAVDPIISYVIVPGDRFVLLLIGEDNKSRNICLYSLSDGEMVWKFVPDGEIRMAAVTPDGSMAVLISGSWMTLLSLADGKSLKHKDSGICCITAAGIAVSGDGRKFAVCAEKAIIFFSLPDLEIVGCPVDIKEMKDNTKGVEVQGVDVLTGEKVTYTLPCGASVPAGAVCTCNCVAGRGGCACNSYHKCNCNSHHTSYSYSYYYPN